MIDLDRKTIIGCVVVVLVLGNTLYARYLKEGLSVVNSQLLAHELLIECANHARNPDPVKSREFIARAKESLPKLEKADAAAVAIDELNTINIPSVSLLQCLERIQSEIDIPKRY
jgi:hypothetical protein